MPRPVQCRRVGRAPNCTYFKPAGVPIRSLQEVVLAIDELEALRLADQEGLYHEDAARSMGVSRRTFGRVISSARNKVARALVQGMALRIEGGVVELEAMRTFCCEDCGQQWQLPFGTGRPKSCPACNGPKFCRTDKTSRKKRSRSQ
jgi:predicted DNA-binding protein (UPF0251 family)